MTLHLIKTDGVPAEGVSAEMCERLKEVIYSYDGRVPLSLAIGVLEIAKREILEEAG